MKNEGDDAGVPLRDKFFADINGKGVCFKPIMGVWDMLCDDDPRKGPIAFRFKDQTVHGASLDIECDDLI